MTLDFSVLRAYEPMIWQGFLLTMKLTMIAIACGSVLGAFCAVGKRGTVPWLRRLCSGYVEVIRNTPLLVQLFLTYFGFSSLGLSLSAVFVAGLTLTVNLGAYAAEIIRAGFDSIEKSQLEAAEALGLSRTQLYWHIILKQALERVYPALTSQFVLLMLASSICSVISAEELTAAANFIQSDTFRPLETYLTVGALYVLFSFVLRGVFWLVGLAVFTRKRRLGTSL